MENWKDGIVEKWKEERGKMEEWKKGKRKEERGKMEGWKDGRMGNGKME